MEAQHLTPSQVRGWGAFDFLSQEVVLRPLTSVLQQSLGPAVAATGA